MPTPPGFQGYREDKRITVYRRNLPHWRQENATYFVTFRLNDSLPAARLREIRRIREEWEVAHPEPRDARDLDHLAQLLTKKQERWLDQGYGSCLLKHPEHQEIMTTALHYFNAAPIQSMQDRKEEPRYELSAYVIMPNHIHLLVRPMDANGHPLEKLLQSWKRYSSREINKARGGKGAIWFEESFDRIVRDQAHLRRCLDYIGRNPLKAGLTTDQCPRWLSPSWRESGWDW